MAAGTAGDPLGALVVETVEQDRAARVHGPESWVSRPRKTITSPGRRRLSVTAAGWPASRVTSLRITAPCPAWGETGSSAASSRSNTKMGGDVGERGHGHLGDLTCRRGRSRVVPIRSAASRSQPGPTCGETCCPITSTPAPGPPSGSQRMATGHAAAREGHAHGRGPDPPRRDLGQRVTGQLTLARDQSSARHTRVRPVTAGAAWPNSRSADTGHDATGPGNPG